LPFWLIVPAATAPILMAVPIPFLRAAVGLVLVTLLPGHLLLGLLDTYRPLKSRLKAVLVVPAGLALTVLVLLILDYSGLYRYRLAIALLILIEEGLALVRLWRGRGLIWVGGRLRFPRRGGSVALAVAALVMLGAVAYAAVTPRRIAPLTEFYLVGADGRLPLEAHGEDLRVVVANHEGRLVRYRIEVRGVVAGQQILLSTTEMSVPAGGRWEQVWEPPAGLRFDSAAWSLYKDGSDLPYRRLKVAAERALAEDLEDAGGEDAEKEDG
jgi:uncharacterized membrane protein